MPPKSSITITILGDHDGLMRADGGEGQAALVGPETFTGVAARVHGRHDGLSYVDPDTGADVVEHRDIAEVESIARQLSTRKIPVVAAHMPIGAAGPEVGTVTAARVDGGLVFVTMTITDDDAKRAIADGSKAQLSLGYVCRIAERADGTRWQTDVRVDHLALAARARCGDQCAITGRGDCASPGKPCACSSPKTRDVLAALRSAADGVTPTKTPREQYIDRVRNSSKPQRTP